MENFRFRNSCPCWKIFLPLPLENFLGTPLWGGGLYCQAYLQEHIQESRKPTPIVMSISVRKICSNLVSSHCSVTSYEDSPLSEILDLPLVCLHLWVLKVKEDQNWSFIKHGIAKPPDWQNRYCMTVWQQLTVLTDEAGGRLFMFTWPHDPEVKQIC